ncbi:nucleolar RNA helicase 2-like isoform X2 [Liolophura sinensis]|uniref:nucleolar RNA helicase 2-like isoform X2 n=1 Tax=Liolophura sinensis TaxID=3198878 RepID=UPI003159588E
MPTTLETCHSNNTKMANKVKNEKKDKKKKNKVNGTSEENLTNDRGDVAVANGTLETSPKPEDKPSRPPAEAEGDFSNFNISDSTIQLLKEKGVTYLFPIQAKTFDSVYAGHDVIAQARTGTGKTLSFALPLVEKLQKKEVKDKRGRPPKVLVMAPTRELARQVSSDFQSISRSLSIACFYGGTPYHPQEKAIADGLDVLVGTPGRLLDHFEKGNIDLSKLKHIVLDEVDQMLDMGFADTVESIIKSAYEREDGKKPQTLLYSATLPPWVYQTSKKYLGEDVKTVDLIGEQSIKTATTVQHLAIKCGYFDRAATLGDVVQVYSGKHGRAMIFCQTKREADELATCADIKLECHVLHGDIPQDKRETVLKKYKEGRYKVLVTTDVAARGLDIPEVDLDVDSYIHRSGRTGRAGRTGVCICFYKPQEEYALQFVEKRAGIKFKKIGAPTTDDLIKAVASDATRALDDVTNETVEHFRESAEKLIEEKGAINALACALAVISGSTTIVSRSLLSSKQGYTTYLFRTNMEMRGASYCWRSLERNLPDVKELAQSMRMCLDKMGCVFDMPSEHDEYIQNTWTDGKFDTLVKATELPELLESFSYRGGGGRGQGRGGFNRQGFRGGNGRGGYGGNNTGYSNRGRFGGNRTFQNGGTFKRKSNFGMALENSPANKRVKFD